MLLYLPLLFQSCRSSSTDGFLHTRPSSSGSGMEFNKATHQSHTRSCSVEIEISSSRMLWAPCRTDPFPSPESLGLDNHNPTQLEGHINLINHSPHPGFLDAQEHLLSSHFAALPIFPVTPTLSSLSPALPRVLSTCHEILKQSPRWFQGSRKPHQ